MIERNARLSAIRKLIETHSIDSQEKLLQYLQQEGFPVTQATLSRDLKYIKVGKIPDGKGGYIYTFPDHGSKAGSEKSLIQDFVRGFLSIEFSGNLGVIKTLPGHASSVASALDNLRIEEILGTVAGDDTILVIPRDRAAKGHILRALQESIPDFKEMI